VILREPCSALLAGLSNRIPSERLASRTTPKGLESDESSQSRNERFPLPQRYR
jgi:hypothetical protein